jgi:hypothetical protein
MVLRINECRLWGSKLHNLFEVETTPVGVPKVASELATLGFVA